MKIKIGKLRKIIEEAMNGSISVAEIQSRFPGAYEAFVKELEELRAYTFLHGYELSNVAFYVEGNTLYARMHESVERNLVWTWVSSAGKWRVVEG